MTRLVARLVTLGAALAAGGWPGGAAMAQDAKGDWHGALSITPTTQLRVVLHLKAGASGALAGAVDSPDQAAFDIPLSDAVAKDGRLSFAVPSLKGTFTGTWDAATHSWTGGWSQGGRDFPISFAAGDVAPTPTVAGLDGEWDGSLIIGTGLSM